MRRREFLQAVVSASASILDVGRAAEFPFYLVSSIEGLSRASLTTSTLNNPLSSGALTPYVDPLSIPPTLQLVPGHTVSVRMRECRQKVHRDLKPTSVWGYNGMWPGPTFTVKRGEPLTVQWSSELPTRHFLPIDPTLHGAESSLPEVRTVVHLHGAQVMPESDGYPEAWFTSDGKTGASYVDAPYQYPNSQVAATLWYHDHAMGINRLNIYAGLAGFYLIQDEQEGHLNLPGGLYDIPLMIQDRTFNPDGSLFYPVVRNCSHPVWTPEFFEDAGCVSNGTHPVWVQEFFGDVNCVNGKVAPFLEVEPRKYRFRLLNAANCRFYHLSLVPADECGNVVGNSTDAPIFHQIGSDSGLFTAPLPSQYLMISPGERFDVVIDFSQHKGMNLALLNNAAAPSPWGGQLVARDVMLFKVKKPLSGTDTSELPNTLVPISPLTQAEAIRERVLSITEMARPSDGSTFIGLLGDKYWSDPVTENPRAGSTEIWSFVNTTEDVHPIHIHLVRFQVLNRQFFDVNKYRQSSELTYWGAPREPEANERLAWKDTVKTYPDTVTRVIAKFELPATAKVATGKAFRYVWHCHMLEHEDNEMMRPYDVIS